MIHMSDKTLRLIKISTAFGLSFVFIFTSILSYWGNFNQACELTFLSNSLTGLFLLIVGILWLCNKHVYQFLFLDFVVLLLIVFVICMVFLKDFSIGGGFKGGFALLHIVNPLLMLIFYLFFSNQTKVKFGLIFTALAMPIAYLTFALIFGAATGNYIYPTLNYTEYGAGSTIIFICGTVVGLTVIGIAMYFVNKLIHKHILKDI